MEEGINRCVESGADTITVVPYSLYPGTKLKDSVKQCAEITRNQKLNLVVFPPDDTYDNRKNQILEE